ncbi:MAG: leucine--tRNA ligase [Saprospiraceae bacterium]
MAFDPTSYEANWRQSWRDNGIYKVETPKAGESAKPKFFVLDMFPYPSGAGLHVGHPLGYIASDIYSRYKRMTGHNVLHPMGYDAFGLPAEQYAIQTGIHPSESTATNIKRYREQFDLIGFSFDWDREVRTTEPQYYKWTQWAFARMFESYYDTAENKAMPISDLVSAFAKTGNADIKAATESKDTFSAEEWNGFSRKQKSEALMNYRIAYRRTSFVNWCEELGTVLANDEVVNGVSERGGFPVEKKAMLQWSLRTSAYAQRLLDGLSDIDWTESLKAQQRNWIGRSSGCQMFFELEGHAEKLEIYTTRPDTIFGTTFMVLAPEHPMVDALTTSDNKTAIDAYRDRAAGRSDIERQADAKEVSGQFTGSYAINPFSGKKLPVYIAEYVLVDYGTGAIMAVPSDDERDERFANHFGIDIISVVDRPEGSSASDKVGTMINSDFLNGMKVKEAIKKANYEVKSRGIGQATTNFKLRDANFSRQRYWGEPFPIIYDAEGIPELVSDDQLPVELPKLDDYKPAPGGDGPLARAKDWVNLPNGYTRETDTMPAVAGSSWYFLRFMDPNNPDAIASKEAMEYWESVDLYVGGTEHAVAHLLYARFWQKFLFDLGKVPVAEPFKKLINQGMIQGVIETIYLHKEDKYFASADLVTDENRDDFAPNYVLVDYISDYGFDDRPSHLTAENIASFKAWRPDYKDTEFRFGADKDKFFSHSEVGKMSKSRYNVVNPDLIIEKYGADTFRMYEMFLGPIEAHKPWNTNGIEGVYKFLRRFYSLFYNEDDQLIVTDAAPTKEQLKTVHATIKKVREDIERFAMNTCVSAFMVCVNELRTSKCQSREALEPLVRLLAPFAPYMTEQLWSDLGNSGSVHHAELPSHDEKHLMESEIEYPISVNGKKRTTAMFSVDATKADIEKTALALEAVQPFIEGKTIKKVIVVPGRMVNIVV